MGYVAIFISILLVFLNAPSAFGSAGCNRILRSGTNGPPFHELVTNPSAESQRFFELLKKGLTARYQNQDDVVEAVELMTANPLDEGHLMTFMFNWNEATWRVQRSLENGVLIYKVPSVNIKNETRPVAMKSRSQSLNGGFSKVLATLNQALREDLLKNPEVKYARIVAASVINPSLLEMLPSIGYVIKREARQKPMVRMDFGHLMDLDSSFANAFDSSDQGHELVWYLQRVPVASSF